MIVVNIEEKDEAIFLKLCKEFYGSCATIRPYDEDIAKKTFRYLTSKHENLWGYLLYDAQTEEPIGYTLLTSYWCNEDGGNVIILDELYISELNRGKGYGTKFLDWIEREFKDKAVSLTLEVLTTNKSAIALYQKLGYSEDGFEVMTKKF